MDRTVINYLTNLVHDAPFIPVPTLSTENKQIFQIDPNFGKGTFRILKFDSSLILILIADFTPNETMEKITDLKQKAVHLKSVAGS